MKQHFSIAFIAEYQNNLAVAIVLKMLHNTHCVTPPTRGKNCNTFHMIKHDSNVQTLDELTTVAKVRSQTFFAKDKPSEEYKNTIEITENPLFSIDLYFQNV